MTHLPILRTAGLCAALAVPFLAGPGGADAQTSAADAATAGPAAEAALALSGETAGFRDGLAAALTDASAAERAAIIAFFATRADAPFWTADGAERAGALQAAMAAASAQGLPPARHDPAALMERLTEGDAPAREAAAMRAYLALAGDIAGGILEPARIDPEITVTPPRPAPDALLAPLADVPVAEALRALEPPSPDYRALMAEKVRLEALLGTDAWGAPVPDGPTLRAGESAPRVALLRARLARLGYSADAAADLSPAAFDPGLEAALQAFQRDHGLLDDGAAGRRTLEALNASVEDRLAQVAVNLERRRWMNRDLGAQHILVNIPDYRVTMQVDGRTAYDTRAIVGSAADTRTPEFSDEMTYMVVNPTWHIPDSIATRVYLPKLKRDPSVLAQSNMRLFTRSGVEINPRLVNFQQYTASSFPFRVKQNPSDANALGQVKFMFPNQFAIYLHDTPGKELFDRDARAFSNGCVRLEEPLELATQLLARQTDDPEAQLAGWIAAGAERTVPLQQPVPVHIVYWTAFPDAGGAVRYRADVYGRDAAVWRALEAAGVREPAAQG